MCGYPSIVVEPHFIGVAKTEKRFLNRSELTGDMGYTL